MLLMGTITLSQVNQWLSKQPDWHESAILSPTQRKRWNEKNDVVGRTYMLEADYYGLVVVGGMVPIPYHLCGMVAWYRPYHHPTILFVSYGGTTFGHSTVVRIP